MLVFYLSGKSLPSKNGKKRWQLTVCNVGSQQIICNWCFPEQQDSELIFLHFTPVIWPLCIFQSRNCILCLNLLVFLVGLLWITCQWDHPHRAIEGISYPEALTLRFYLFLNLIPSLHRSGGKGPVLETDFLWCDMITGASSWISLARKLWVSFLDGWNGWACVKTHSLKVKIYLCHFYLQGKIKVNDS